MDLIKIGKYIAGKRKSLGMTQKQLAEKLGMSKSSARKCNLGIKALEWLRSAARDEFEKSSRFTPPATLKNLPAMPVRSFPKETRPEKAGS